MCDGVDIHWRRRASSERRNREPLILFDCSRRFYTNTTTGRSGQIRVYGAKTICNDLQRLRPVVENMTSGEPQDYDLQRVKLRLRLLKGKKVGHGALPWWAFASMKDDHPTAKLLWGLVGRIYRMPIPKNDHAS